MISLNQALCTKNDINHKFWAHLKSVLIMAFVIAPSSKVEIYRGMKGSHLSLLYNFKLKGVFLFCFFLFCFLFIFVFWSVMM